MALRSTEPNWLPVKDGVMSRIPSGQRRNEAPMPCRSTMVAAIPMRASAARDGEPGRAGADDDDVVDGRAVAGHGISSGSAGRETVTVLGIILNCSRQIPHVPRPADADRRGLRLRSRRRPKEGAGWPTTACSAASWRARSRPSGSRNARGSSPSATSRRVLRSTSSSSRSGTSAPRTCSRPTRGGRRPAGALLPAGAGGRRSEGIEDGYRITTNVGERGGQSIPHLHFHVLGAASSATSTPARRSPGLNAATPATEGRASRVGGSA
jgi:hypothetical protein